ncbi:MAG: hypothetical protein UU73_C0003G0140 [Candidatus Daviesbacteria bacterium GW2011_GWA1_41_61]|nr:MAG: hypothetical protein UU44_C0002G0171 [Candidatus Daviesbacteria bacterium GW2011_GWB1_41_15]KKS14941.1 MAG: hypothetical protein UU73_C0003G0140 [Candidatus Daviesbacteria bacterium GW2011_GWA1_41_61]
MWYSTTADIRSPDTVHQVLMYGTLQEIRSLKKTLGEKWLKELFLHYPKKIYTKPALNFIKNFVLDINSSIDEQKYLKTTPRYIR